MSQRNFSERPTALQKAEDAKLPEHTAESKRMSRKIERDRRNSYIFCMKRLKEHHLWQKYGPVLKQADQLIESDLVRLLSEDPSCRSYASDFNLDQLPIEAFSYCLEEVNLDTADQLGKLTGQGPIAWICLSEIIRCFSHCADLRLRHPKNISAIMARIEHIQPLANACMLLTGKTSGAEDTDNYLGYENFTLILQAGADAMEVAVSYITLLQQPTFALSPTVLNLESAALPAQTWLDAPQTQDPAHLGAWLTLFVVLPGLATAHKAIYQCEELSQHEKLLFLHQAIHLGINIQAISEAMEVLDLSAFLTNHRLQQLFAFIAQGKGQHAFIPGTLAQDIATSTDLLNLQKTLADQQYISSNFVAAKCLSDVLVSACSAGMLNPELYNTLLYKARHFTPVMGEALRFLADQPQQKQYTTDCRRVLTTRIFNQILDLISPLDKKNNIAPDPQQINQEVFKIVLTVMGNKKAIPALNAKHYPHLYAYQRHDVSRQKSKPSELACSFFSSSFNVEHPNYHLLQSYSSLDSSASSSLGLIEEPENRFEPEVRESKSRTITQTLETWLSSTKHLTDGESSPSDTPGQQHVHAAHPRQQLVGFLGGTLNAGNEQMPAATGKASEEQLCEAEQEKAIDTHSPAVLQ